ncbi:oxidoreductase [SAR202 cluster bacterium AC-647-N09_OGT_505m]|nr:oxidoreductase [SAR202 cluster bacterium AC-647-N09_OGT_505m]
MDFEGTITAIRQETPTVKSFVLDLGGGEIDFLPGQYVDLFIDSLRTIEGAGYSIISTPLEKGTISIAVKKLPEAKSAIYLHENAQVGDAFILMGPDGEFQYKEGIGVSVVLIAGGIGITPLISMFRYVHEAQPDIKLSLLYSARVPSELAFYDELKATSAQNPNITCYFAITRPEEEPWDGPVGRVNREMLRDYAADVDSVFYICGPTEMPDEIAEILRGLGVEESRINTEAW